jgi:hypothetical protein
VRRAAPALRKIGIHVAFDRDGHDGARIIAVEKRSKPEQRPESSSASSGSSAKMAASNKINDLAAKAADDALTMADDPADDALTILDGAIVSNNPLKGNGSDDADDADDVSAFCSGEGSIGEKPAAPHRCAQCAGEPDGRELLHMVQGSPTWLHRECARFFRLPVGDPPEAA